MKKKSNKIKRYLKVFRNRLRSLTAKKIFTWVNRNLKEHPFILGILFVIWIGSILDLFFESNKALSALVKFHLVLHAKLFISWLVLVLISNGLKDKKKARWYFKKRFVMLMLLLITPLGLILLWIGSQYKRATKITLTVIFVSAFISLNVYQAKKFQKNMRMSSFEHIVEMIVTQTNKTYLPHARPEAIKELKLVSLSRREHKKIAVSEIYSRYAPSIISIKTKDKDGKALGLGSGFIISKNGFVITNSHVIKGAYKVELTIGKDVFTEVFLVKHIPSHDIAVLKVNALELSPLAIGDSDVLVSGQFIVALGNPLGLEQSVSSGIISAIRSGPQIKLIQMTAPVSPGSSGGPLLNEYGEVVGITTLASFFMAQNLNFAIPINYLKKAIAH